MFVKVTKLVIFLMSMVPFGITIPQQQLSHHHHHHHHHHNNIDQDSYEESDNHKHTDWPLDDQKVSNLPFHKARNVSTQLYKEIFVLATGDNLASPEVANEVHINARTVVLLSQKLSYMKITYETLMNHVLDYAVKNVKIEDKQVVTDLVGNIVSELKNIPEFDTIKSGLSELFIVRHKYFKNDGDKEKEKDIWIRDPLIQHAILNKMFYMIQCHQNSSPLSKVVQAILEHAQDKNCYDKLEKIYSTAVNKTLEEFCPVHDEHKVRDRFFQLLIEELTADVTLSFKLYDKHKIMIVQSEF